MDVTSIPFAETVGIKRSDDGRLMLPCVRSVHNHLETIHASAQFALAETASADALQFLFPELVGKVLALLRESKVKFRSPAVSELYAFASISEQSAVKFKKQLEQKGRALIEVEVKLSDADGAITSAGLFNWLLQELPDEDKPPPL